MRDSRAGASGCQAACKPSSERTAAVTALSRCGSRHFRPAWFAHVEGVGHHVAHGRDAGGDHVEAGVEEGTGDPVQETDLVGGMHFDDGRRL